MYPRQCRRSLGRRQPMLATSHYNSIKSLGQRYQYLMRRPLSLSLLSMAVRVVTILHQFKAPTATVCGHDPSNWSMENGIPLRWALSNISIHGTQSSARPRVRVRILQEGSVVRAQTCVFDARRARLRLRAAVAGCLRSPALEVVRLYGGWICGGSVCR